MSRPLFIPLRREYFEAFERGEKTEEYRPYGPRWNERTCFPGRPVVLSLGYGKARRLTGVICAFTTDSDPGHRPGWRACYDTRYTTAAVITITLILRQ